MNFCMFLLKVSDRSTTLQNPLINKVKYGNILSFNLGIGIDISFLEARLIYVRDDILMFSEDSIVAEMR